MGLQSLQGVKVKWLEWSLHASLFGLHFDGPGIDSTSFFLSFYAIVIELLFDDQVQWWEQARVQLEIIKHT